MDNEPRFEEMLSRLDVIVHSLERGVTPLEESLALDTEGSERIRKCTEKLSGAEQVVVKLRKGPDGAPEELPFDTEDS